jgi:ArsR family transcriptional regulator, lead/cadmium/zinc/bismuth-responsive transcriptional repressor
MKRLSEAQVGLIVERSRALSDSTRVKILEVLARSEQPVGQIAAALQSEPSLVSKHLQVLHHAELVGRRREANTVIYWLVSARLLDYFRFLAAPDLMSASRHHTVES